MTFSNSILPLRCYAEWHYSEYSDAEFHSADCCYPECQVKVSTFEVNKTKLRLLDCNWLQKSFNYEGKRFCSIRPGMTNY